MKVKASRFETTNKFNKALETIENIFIVAGLAVMTAAMFYFGFA